MMSVVRVLETDFGRGTIVNGDEYAGKQRERYSSMLDLLLKKREGNYQNWAYPPLPSLKLNYQNAVADDGYAGQILHSTQGDGSYPAKQINDPSENFGNGVFDI
ncbi:MAG: hypothetical protein HC842_07150 [Cytophagales bacterium]|nr:hypothetical protein [Cytophagales bacterium]